MVRFYNPLVCWILIYCFYLFIHECSKFHETGDIWTTLKYAPLYLPTSKIEIKRKAKIKCDTIETKWGIRNCCQAKILTVFTHREGKRINV